MTATDNVCAGWDDVMDAIETEIVLGEKPYEVGSARGTVPCDEVCVTTKFVTIDHDVGDDLPTCWSGRKEILVRGRPYILDIQLTFHSASLSDDGWSIRTVYAVGLNYGKHNHNWVPPVVIGPGGDFCRAPIGRHVDVVA